jgi:glycerol-3-phosphate acyltransferase PlsX
MIKIAVDAMGGDHAPEATVRGALDCLDSPKCDFQIVLVGDEKRIRELMGGRSDSRVAVVHASEVVEMDDSAAATVKTKKDSSIMKALRMQHEGEVQGFLSAGNTGAVMAASTLVLGRIPGVLRPTIGTFIPSLTGATLVIDAGANVDCKPVNLQQFGIMGSLYIELMRHKKRPTVGLINVGEEEGKGNALVAESYGLLKQTQVNFIGNIEGRDILKGTADVAVCDGFVGNIILKFAESFPGFLKNSSLAYAGGSIVKKLILALWGAKFRPMFKSWDYQEFGGVPLLGVNGTSLIGHGSSTPKAIKNMILTAKEMIDNQVHTRIAEAFASMNAV